MAKDVKIVLEYVRDKDFSTGTKKIEVNNALC